MTPRPYSEVSDTVFAKTPLGRAEIGQRSAGLSARQRSILIMLDGQKPLRGIDTLIPQEQIADIVAFLQAAGLVEAQADAAPAPAPPAAVAPTVAPTIAPTVAPMIAPIIGPVTAPTPQPAAAPPAPDAPRLQDIKTLMIETAKSYLGLMAADIVRRVEGASNEAQLMAVLGQWHMAMRDSKYGKDVAGAYLEEIKARFAGAPAPNATA